jgi:hypothetical protein
VCENRTNNSDTGIASLLGIGAAVIIIIVMILLVPVHAATLVPPTLPDPKLTPGALAPGVVSSLTKAQLCAKGFSTKSVRDVTEEEKAAVYARYGAKDHHGAYQ